jgi:hypothetical protein
MDFVCKDNPRALIPDGVYEAVCTGYAITAAINIIRKNTNLNFLFSFITPPLTPLVLFSNHSWSSSANT